MADSSELNLARPEDFEILCSIWVMASNDQNRTMVYEGITYRLGLQPGYNVKGLVRLHPELFRPGIPSKELEMQQAIWKADPSKRPAWILKSIDSEDGRLAKIDSLSTNDVFRSQFRIAEQAPQSPVTIIDWGLLHIERLRNAQHQSLERTAKDKEVRWILLLTGANLVVTIIAALIHALVK